MDGRRGEQKNWYSLIENRQKQMDFTVRRDALGRQSLQIISGSIGFDDWEWAVDLFSNEPVHFKKLIYEMRFDEVSAEYSNFGIFMVGVRTALKDLGTFLEGTLPNLTHLP